MQQCIADHPPVLMLSAGTCLNSYAQKRGHWDDGAAQVCIERCTTITWTEVEAHTSKENVLTLEQFQF